MGALGETMAHRQVCRSDSVRGGTGGARQSKARQGKAIREAGIRHHVGSNAPVCIRPVHAGCCCLKYGIDDCRKESVSAPAARQEQPSAEHRAAIAAALAQQGLPIACEPGEDAKNLKRQLEMLSTVTLTVQCHLLVLPGSQATRSLLLRTMCLLLLLPLPSLPTLQAQPRR